MAPCFLFRLNYGNTVTYCAVFLIYFCSFLQYNLITTKEQTNQSAINGGDRMITLISIIAYLGIMVLLLKIFLWVTKMWLKATIILLEIVLVLSALSFLF